MDSDKISVICSVERIICYKNNWGVVNMSVDKILKGSVESNLITLTGNMPEPKIRNSYKVTANLVTDPKYGKQYKIVTIADNVSFEADDKVGQKKFLSNLFTENQIKAMYEALPDPYEVFINGEIDKLLKVKGCGFDTAGRWMVKFNNHLDLAKIYCDLEEYNLTNHMITQLMNTYKSPDIIINKVKENPYILCNEVNGIGWKTADSIALNGGIEPLGKIRVKAFIQYYLNESGTNGNSWITPDELLGAIIEALGEQVKDAVISESLIELIEEKVVYTNKDKTQIGLMKYYNIEHKLAEEMIRILKAPNNFDYGDWRQVVSELEKEQGWCFTDEQKEGIEASINNNIVLITGLAGTGKTSVVSALLRVLRNKYSYAQTALSGRAASKLSEVTHQEGYTIHRLLGYPSIEPNSKQMFTFHDENKLGIDIIIVDEVSMIDSYLFYDLLRAVKDGAKVIMLGDYGQIESIGIGNVAYDVMNSPEIPTIVLHEIHRQALSSAIITESLKVRKGEQIINKEYTGVEVRGKDQDFLIDCFSDKSNTYYKIMEHFSKALHDEQLNILDIQVIVPLKSKGTACVGNLNLAIQEVYNPASKNKNSIDLFQNGKITTLRVGDKVINTVNNYRTKPAIYNGNIGIIESIGVDNIYDEDGNYVTQNVMVVDFIGIGKVILTEDAYKNLNLGYAITIHKFQGSSAKCVIFGIDMTSYIMLTRELVYTAITRAEQKCILVCQNAALRFATSREGVSKKQTFLQECLYDVAHPKLVF